MRESCKYGSVRGADSNGGPYRNRREFVTLVGGAAAAWPIAARAQQAERMRRIGVPQSRAADDPEGQARSQHSSSGYRNWDRSKAATCRSTPLARIQSRRLRKYSAELVRAPDVILAAASPSVTALQHVTRIVPIVFTIVVDPVAVAS